MAIDDNKNYTLTGEQVKDLATRLGAAITEVEDKAEKALTGSTAPTSETEGEIGQLYIQSNGSVYVLQDIVEESGESGFEYIWENLGAPIQSISVNGTAVTPDANKNVDLTIEGGIKTLTTEDYNYPTNNPIRIAPWLLPDGFYKVPSGMAFQYDSSSYGNVAKDMIIIVLSSRVTSAAKLVFLPARFDSTEIGYTCYNLSPQGSIVYGYLENILTGRAVVNVLTSTSTYQPLSANMGKTLNERIGDLTTLTTTAKTSAVAAINELASAGASAFTTNEWNALWS